MGMDKKTSYAEVFSKDKYRVIVLDMDGTLYYQRGMQILMCIEMGAFAIMHPFSLWKLNAVSVFRCIRELDLFSKEENFGKDSGCIEKDLLLEQQYKMTADKINKPPETVKQVIEEWMFKRPLKYLQYTCDRRLCDWIEIWKQRGRKVVVYSDYPAGEKCDILGIHADAIYSSEQEEIGQMKPSVRGLELISREFAASPDEILVVGDRMSKDGRMAEYFGCEYLILKKWKLWRNKKY